MKNNKDEKIVCEAIEFFLKNLLTNIEDISGFTDMLFKRKITFMGDVTTYYLHDNIGQILYWNRKCTFGKKFDVSYKKFAMNVNTKVIIKEHKKCNYYICLHDVRKFYSSIKYVVQYYKKSKDQVDKTPYEFFTIRNDSKIGRIDI